MPLDEIGVDHPDSDPAELRRVVGEPVQAPAERSVSAFSRPCFKQLGLVLRDRVPSGGTT
jgi:hypothetical protein